MIVRRRSSVITRTLARLAHARPHQAADALKRAHLSGEAARSVHDDQDFPIHAGLDHFDAARDNHQHRTVAIAGLRQYLPLAHSTVRSERFQPCNLRRRQLREHLRLAAAERGSVGQAFSDDLRGHVRNTSISSLKHQLQSSPGSKDEIIACLDLRKCLRA